MWLWPKKSMVVILYHRNWLVVGIWLPHQANQNGGCSVLVCFRPKLEFLKSHLCLLFFTFSPDATPRDELGSLMWPLAWTFYQDDFPLENRLLFHSGFDFMSSSIISSSEILLSRNPHTQNVLMHIIG